MASWRNEGTVTHTSPSFPWRSNALQRLSWHVSQDTVPTARGFDESLSFLMGGSKYLQNSDKNIVNAIIRNCEIDDFMRWNVPFFISHNEQPNFQPGELEIIIKGSD